MLERHRGTKSTLSLDVPQGTSVCFYMRRDVVR